MPQPDRIAVFDTETNSPDPEEAQVVTAFIGLMDSAGELTEKWSWLLRWDGMQIPDEAAAIHGITTEHALEHGTDAKRGIFDIAQRLDILSRQVIPVVIYNAQYDLTVMDREMGRYYPGARFSPPGIVIDPYVLDKGVDKYRKGSRKLVDTAAHYKVPVAENAHDAEADCVMAGRVALKLLNHRRLRDLPLRVIHAKTVPTYREQMEHLKGYYEGKHKAATDPTEREEWATKALGVTSFDWPMRPRPVQEA